MFSLINIISAFYLENTSGDNFLGVERGKVVMVKRQGDAADLSMQHAIGKSYLYAIFSLGASALAFEDSRLTTLPIDKTDNRQAFVTVLTVEDTYIIKHGDKCLGLGGEDSVEGMECNAKSVLKFKRINIYGNKLGNPRTGGWTIVKTSTTTRSGTSFSQNDVHQ